MEPFESRRDGFLISTSPERLDMNMILDFLATTYWASQTDRDVARRSITNAVPFGLYTDAGEQIGFSRVVTDYARFAWLSDVFVLDAYRGRGLGLWLVETVLNYKPLRGLKRWALSTDDAHGLYAKAGFTPLPSPEKWMICDGRSGKF